jgi:hypothetical protein
MGSSTSLDGFGVCLKRHVTFGAITGHVAFTGSLVHMQKTLHITVLFHIKRC